MLPDAVVDLIGDSIPGKALPVVVFITSAVIALSTGSSWATMTIVFPIAIPLANNASGGSLTIRLENVIGWYHSHPGYGCWLSGIDVATQMLNQQFQEPWLAVVIDPTRTVSAGKVEIGAFRSYPEGYKPPDAVDDGFQSVPL